MQLHANDPRPDTHTAFTNTNWRTYKEMMALARDAQQWTLAAAAILKEWMERMSHSTSCQCSTSNQCRRSRSSGWQEEGSQVTSHCRETEARPGSFQANSHQEGAVDINFFKYLKTSQVTSHQRALLRNGPSSPAALDRNAGWHPLRRGHPHWGKPEA